MVFLGNEASILVLTSLIFSGTIEGNVNGIGGMETHLEGIAKRNVRIAGKIDQFLETYRLSQIPIY